MKKGISLLSCPHHIGVVVPDLNAAMNAYISALGIKFSVFEVDETNSVFSGSSDAFRLRIGFGTLGPSAMELIQPVSGETIHSRFLSERGGGIHHLGFLVSGFSKVKKQLDALRCRSLMEGAIKGLDFSVVGRGRSGEVAQGAADRMKREVEETRPDLLVWQVGTNDAIRHVSLDSFKTCLKTTLSWLADSKIDVVLVDPQYGEALARDAYYATVVEAVAEVAREHRVLLVDRFEAMREAQRERGDPFYLSSDNLHMNDRGHRCMAEQLARSIVGGLLHADSDTGQPVLYPN